MVAITSSAHGFSSPSERPRRYDRDSEVDQLLPDTAAMADGGSPLVDPASVFAILATADVGTESAFTTVIPGSSADR